MKPFHLFFLIALPVMTTISCGSDNDDNDDGAQRAEEKNLFSRWTRTDGFVVDLRQGRFNTPFDIFYVHPDGANCSCLLRITGSQNSGETDLFSCAYTGGGNGDPGCVQLNNSATFTKDETELRVCDERGCDIFR